MEPVKSTAEILYLKITNRTNNKNWVDWAVEMLLAGFDSDYLAVLANQNDPYFQNQDLIEKVLGELSLNYSDKDNITKNYLFYLVDRVLNNEMSSDVALSIISNICLDLNCPDYLMNFYLLHWANDNLRYENYQEYWPGATRDNIESCIRGYFIAWKKVHTES